MPPKGWKKKKEEGEQLKLQQEQEGKSKDEKEPKAKDAKEHKSKEGKEGKVKEPKEPKAKDGKKEGKEAKSKDAKAPKDPKDAASTEAAASAPAKEEKEKKDKKDKDRRGSRSASRSRSRSRRRDRKESRSASPPPKKKKDKDRKKDKEKEKDKEKGKEKEKAKEKADSGSRHRSPSAAASRSRSASRARRKDRSNEPTRPEGDDPAAGDKPKVPDWLADLVQAPGAAAAGARPQPPRREVMVPQQFVARLIGRGGEAIMGICSATGAEVKIRQETKDMGYSLAVITGRPDAMENAEIMVRQKLGLSSTGVATKEIPIPAELVGSVIGPKGAAITEIRARAGGMPVEVRSPDVAGMPHRAILGPGQQEQLLIVEHLLTGKMAEAAMQRLPL
uniref:K Homology domain-containing protein n=1 Tax=Alexandrium catenella TaxID=2925 RepID=A0A7S1WT79_ALECA|mmetsp:Transcript_87007/g.231225  ORF Transcript_87007/g.231225 Transcript_87007/m.231225 type:complete len:391 (+) Transcript_87007:192-1364(+)